VTVFASDQEFPAGEVIRGKDVADRVVHRFYTLDQEAGRIRVQADPVRIVKRTIEIETR
jgi:serine/threonine-protein kinase